MTVRYEAVLISKKQGFAGETYDFALASQSAKTKPAKVRISMGYGLLSQRKTDIFFDGKRNVVIYDEVVDLFNALDILAKVLRCQIMVPSEFSEGNHA